MAANPCMMRRRAGVFHYFGYGSNMLLTSLRAKGVEPRESRRATLRGWKLAFDVHHWFRHEGGVGNIHPSDEPGAHVQGVVHLCEDTHLPRLDAVESLGVGYDRIEVDLVTAEGPVRAHTYVGVPTYLDPDCLPTRRYLNIIVRGAEEAGLEAAYVERLRRHPLHVAPEYPPFEPPAGVDRVVDAAELARCPTLTALVDAVFDMSGCRWQHECLLDLFGGKDMTLFHLKRHDSSDGTETLADVASGRISEAGRAYLNAYLHEYAEEYRYVGRYQREDT